MDRLYAPSNSAEHPQHPIQLLLFVSSLGIDRKPKSAKDRFIDSSNRGLHSRKSIHRIAERDEAPCCRPGLVGVCGTRFDSARGPELPGRLHRPVCQERDRRSVSAATKREAGRRLSKTISKERAAVDAQCGGADAVPTLDIGYEEE